MVASAMRGAASNLCELLVESLHDASGPLGFNHPCDRHEGGQGTFAAVNFKARSAGPTELSLQPRQ